jgi:hypothetical protein
MKILVAGSRTIHSDAKTIREMMNRCGVDFSPWDTLVCGMCESGIDKTVVDLARELNIKIEEHPADWVRLGKRAGPSRNRDMAVSCDIAVVIWDGKSSGTKSMIAELVSAGKPFSLLTETKDGFSLREQLCIT